MRTSLARLGMGFGNLGVTVRGTTKYHLSPMEQRAFAGAISTGNVYIKYFSHLLKWVSGIPNTLWRMRTSFFTVVPPFVISYLIYDAAEKEHDR